jgi:predicted AAA+ superfamily ATPase
MNKRDLYLKRIAPFIGKPVIKVLTGMRRVGKSYLLRQLRDELIQRGVSPGHIHLDDHLLIHRIQL